MVEFEWSCCTCWRVEELVVLAKSHQWLRGDRRVQSHRSIEVIHMSFLCHDNTTRDVRVSQIVEGVVRMTDLGGPY